MRLRRFKTPLAVAQLPDGTVLVAGGGDQAELYDPTARSFGPAVGSLGAARYFSSATLLDDRRVLIAGGYAERSDGNMPSTIQTFLFTR
jgi:hypothetical protein